MKLLYLTKSPREVGVNDVHNHMASCRCRNVVSTYSRSMGRHYQPALWSKITRRFGVVVHAKLIENSHRCFVWCSRRVHRVCDSDILCGSMSQSSLG